METVDQAELGGASFHEVEIAPVSTLVYGLPATVPVVSVICLPSEVIVETVNSPVCPLDSVSCS